MDNLVRPAAIGFVLALALVAIAPLAASAASDGRSATYSSSDLGHIGKGGKKRKLGNLGKASAWDGGPANVAGGIVWRAPGGCLPGSVVNALHAVSARFGRVVVNSTHRSRKRNRRAGGAHRSLHLGCRAADFRVLGGNKRAVLAFLRAQPGLGGIKLYPGGFFHIDNGPKRSW